MRTYRNRVEQEKGKKQALEEYSQEQAADLQRRKKRLRNLKDALLVVQHVSQKTQEELKYQITELVTLALKAVFEDPYEFDIDFVHKRGKTEAEVSFIRDGEKIDPMTASGGGAVDIASFALRITLWNLHRPRTANTIILDEPARFVSDDLQPKFGEMLKMISDKLNIQFIIVTHKKALMESADKVFHVIMKNKNSEVKEN